jgi:hypothetical protein
MNIAYAVYCRRVFRFYQLFFLLLFLHSYAVDGDKMNNIQSHHTWNRVYFNGSWWDVEQLTMLLKIVNYDSEYKPTVLHREPAVAEGSGVNGYIVLAVTMLTNFATEFLFCKLVVYRYRENTRK